MDDTIILRDLTKRYVDVCADPDQSRRRDLWRRHNSLKPTPIPVWVRTFAWDEMPEAALQCRDRFYHPYESFLRQSLFRSTFRDDYILEPWVTVGAVHTCTTWGLQSHREHAADPGGSYKADYAIKAPEDVAGLKPPQHAIDEAATAQRLARVQDAIGDLITINLDRGPFLSGWHADLSTDLGALRGIENFMLDMYDRPEWLHDLLAFMRDGVLRCQAQAEAAGDWGLCNHINQSAPYAEELPAPAANARGAGRRQLWCFMAAQEFTLVSPQFHEEFLLRYQRPIMEQFGLVSYGCCEDLTGKIDMLRQIPNLRRIAVAPAANVARCAEQIGRDYVISYRPSPSDMVGYGWDPGRVRRILRQDLEACRGCCVDITLKDVETVQGDPERVRNWVRIAREVIESVS